jgi:hypothetical protein
MSDKNVIRVRTLNDFKVSPNNSQYITKPTEVTKPDKPFETNRKSISESFTRGISEFQQSITSSPLFPPSGNPILLVNKPVDDTSTKIEEDNYNFTNRLLWFLAITFCIFTLGFYFFSLQPVALERLMILSMQRIDEIESDYNISSNKVENILLAIDTALTVNTIESSCLNQKTISTQALDISKIKSLTEKDLVPKTDFQQPINTFKLKHEYFNQVTRNAYSAYSSRIESLKRSSENYIQALNLVEFKNQLILSCQEMTNNSFSLNAAQNQCQLLQDKKTLLTNSIESSNTQDFNLLNIIRNSLTSSCTALSNSTTNFSSSQWRADFLKDYTTILNAKSIPISIEEINRLKDSLNMQLKESRDQIEKEFNTKNSGNFDLGNIYLLQVEI